LVEGVKVMAIIEESHDLNVDNDGGNKTIDLYLFL